MTTDSSSFLDGQNAFSRYAPPKTYSPTGETETDGQRTYAANLIGCGTDNRVTRSLFHTRKSSDAISHLSSSDRRQPVNDCYTFHGMDSTAQKRRVAPTDPVAIRIKDIRVRILRKTQDEMAEEMGVTKALVSGWETGRYRPSYEALEKLKKASKLTIDYILSGDEMVYRDVGGEHPALHVAEAQAYFADDGLDFDRERSANLPKSIRAKINGFIAGAIEAYEQSKPKRKFTRQENRMRGRLTGEIQRGGKKK